MKPRSQKLPGLGLAVVGLGTRRATFAGGLEDLCVVNMRKPDVRNQVLRKQMIDSQTSMVKKL